MAATTGARGVRRRTARSSFTRTTRRTSTSRTVPREDPRRIPRRQRPRRGPCPTLAARARARPGRVRRRRVPCRARQRHRRVGLGLLGLLHHRPADRRSDRAGVGARVSLHVYIAASPSDLERVDHWTARLAAAGIVVVSTWPAVVRAAGAGNPRDATKEQRASWAAADLLEVGGADLVWLLVPAKPSFGAGFECGYASHGPVRAGLVSSGDTRSSIFTALGHEFDTDEEAFAWIVEGSR